MHCSKPSIDVPHTRSADRARAFACLLAAGALVVAGAADTARAQGQSDLPEASYAPHTSYPFALRQPLPPQITNAFRSDPELTQYPWVCDPAYMHDTGPTPDDYCYRGEWDLTGGVLFGWGDRVFGCGMPDQIELIRASLGSTAEVTILTDPEVIPSVKRCLRDNGFAPSQIDAINFAPVKIDTPWIRDYGPEFLSRCDGSPADRAVVDPTYFGVIPRQDNCQPLERGPLQYGRSRDDASPTRLAGLVQNGKVALRGVDTMSVHRPPLVFEGGNIFTDGQGTCFRNRIDTNAQNTEMFFYDPRIAGGWSYDQTEVDALIASYYNCERVVVLESMRPTSFADPGPGVIDHIDMTVTFLSADTVLVGDYDYRDPNGRHFTVSGTSAPDDPFNDPILDENAERLSSLGYRVVRIPMPAPYCARDFAANCRPDRDLSSDTVIACPASTFDEQGLFVGGVDPNTGEPIFRTWATFANSIRVGNRLMMPSFYTSSLALPQDLGQTLRDQEREALRVYRAELARIYGPGEVEVVPIPSDGLAPCVGSLQCITKTY